MNTKDGGPAFPSPGVVLSNGSQQGAYEGMSLRDYFATGVVQSINITYAFNWTPRRLAEGHPDFEAHQVAAYAYKVADAMLAERTKQ